MLGTLDGRDKPGQDEVIRPISLLFRRKVFPGQPCAPRERADQA
jgi:hypothetical protein